MTDELKELLEAHKHSTQGKWQKGRTTHHTVTETGYLIGELHHADDAALCDLAHEIVPSLIAKIERLTDETADLKNRLHNEKQSVSNFEARLNAMEVALKKIVNGRHCPAIGERLSDTEMAALAREALLAFGAAPEVGLCSKCKETSEEVTACNARNCPTMAARAALKPDIGRCCYGGQRSRQDCGDCAAWTPAQAAPKGEQA